MDTLTGIKVFLTVVDLGSFVRTAEYLELSTATVSRHVMHIEHRLGARLLNRNSRTLSVTEPGRVYYARCKSIVDELEATELELVSLGGAPRGTLRITAPSWLASGHMAGMLARFRDRYPEVLVDISFEDRMADLVEEGFDVALRVTEDSSSLGPGLIARALQPITCVMAASHDYLKRNGVPKTPEDLARHDLIAVASLDTWELYGPEGKVEVPARGAQRYRSAAGLVHAVAAGAGIAPLPSVHFEDPAFRNVLVPLLPNYPLKQATIYLVYASRKYLPLKLRAFIDFAVDEASRLRPVALRAAA